MPTSSTLKNLNMKKHYHKSFYAVLIALLIAAYFLNAQKRDEVEIGTKPVVASSKAKLKGPIAAKPDESSITSIQQSLTKREYNISFDQEKKSLQSPNRKQGLRAYYKPGELTINNRVDSGGHNFSLKLVNKASLQTEKRFSHPKSKPRWTTRTTHYKSNIMASQKNL